MQRVSILASYCELGGDRNVYALVCDVDGIDWLGDNVGAIITPDLLYRAEQMRIIFSIFLVDNSSYIFFKQADDFVIINIVRTNVSG